MADPFDSQEDTQMYLHGTVCMYKNVPVYVEVRGRNRARVTRLDRSDSFEEIDTTVPEFHWHDMTLGYYNHGDYCAFLKRTPDRRQKVGLTVNNVVSSNPNVIVELLSPAMHKCLTNDYPSYEETLAWIKKKKGRGVGRAFHKLFALTRIDRGLIGLHFRERLVAVRAGKVFTMVEGEDMSLIHRLLARYGIELTDK